MTSEKMGLTKMMIRIGLISSCLSLSLSSLAVAQDYIPPPTGPYNSSVAINRIDRLMPDQDRGYRFPPADLVEPPPPLMEDALATDKDQAAEQPVAGSMQPEHAAQVPRLGAANDYRPVYPGPQQYPSAAQWAYPYNYGNGWNTNPQTYSYPPAYPQQPYPYGYNQYDSTNNFFPGMPTPWTDNPMQQFFGQ